METAVDGGFVISLPMIFQFNIWRSFVYNRYISPHPLSLYNSLTCYYIPCFYFHSLGCIPLYSRVASRLVGGLFLPHVASRLVRYLHTFIIGSIIILLLLLVIISHIIIKIIIIITFIIIILTIC